ncbi:unnamed protein product [Bursaphelenchus okinawaensis]|uniref:PSP proline-rich domain-containing protein n=1 Tax=Bursaphelenchus okinawaensis TaxID=465554 RepID=A0A811LAG6_9BILA|nr:unnamed protein product [Bursaphelenchus okinawaensis]CAG9119707.1 unnamed protein product [Bursaphelenchus okinawaensis]
MAVLEYDSEEEQELTEKERQEIERKRKKNKKKKESKKRTKNQPLETANVNGEKNNDDEIKIEVEYVPDEIDIPKEVFGDFVNVFNRFKTTETEEVKEELVIDEPKLLDSNTIDSFNKAAISEQILQDEMKEKKKEEGDVESLSRKKLRLSMQPSIAELKANTTRPDVVEWADVTSRDPHILVHLKAYRNTVPVPRHWNAKRKYLAGKRGFERPPFELPDFVKRTGIMEMRETMWEKEGEQTLKSKMRERMRPKMGRIDIDYQKLHDAFFKWQTKPEMTVMGELYYEGKEMETQMKEKKPGILSDELRIALGMPVGPTANKFPPPWLIAMQRYGPPPSYPNLKIPGLNCPIPEGCSFGYHAGGWGKPPVDETGKPVYGDVFGLTAPENIEPEDESKIERVHWGEIESDEGESDEASDVEEDENEPMEDDDGLATPMPEGTVTPSGVSMMSGMETPESIEIRKARDDAASVSGIETPVKALGQLYTILQEKKVDKFGKDIMGSTHVYDLSKKSKVDGIEISLNPEELDLGDKKHLEERYEEQLRKQAVPKNDDKEEEEEDFSDMIADHSRRKRKAEQKKIAANEKKKHKDFKF